AQASQSRRRNAGIGSASSPWFTPVRIREVPTKVAPWRHGAAVLGSIDQQRADFSGRASWSLERGAYFFFSSFFGAGPGGGAGAGWGGGWGCGAGGGAGAA